MTLCVYALAGGGARVTANGLGGERLRVYREGPVAAIAGQLRHVPRVSADTLRRYEGTVRRLADALPVILPVRFGSCFEDADELAFVLRSRRPTLLRLLAHVRNRVQMTVRVMTSPAPPATDSPRRRAVPSRDLTAGGAIRAGSPRSGGPGAAYLHDRVEAAARAREIPGFDPVRAAVRRWLRDERVHRRDAVVSVYHLIPRAAAEPYRRALERAAAAAGLRVVVSGPWPAYAFTDTLS